LAPLHLEQIGDDRLQVGADRVGKWLLGNEETK
jgi:hypothetical protein